jgi:phosphoserine phosphatase
MLKVPKSYVENLKSEILKALDDPSANKIAAFDADGTCWFSDVGRDFYDYQITKGFFKDSPLSWEDYFEQESVGMTQGLLWLAQILKGFHIDEVRAFGKKFNQDVRPHFIDHQTEIIQFLKSQGVEVYIVTASVKWTIEAAAEEIGISSDNVIGVETDVQDGIITDIQKGHMTWAEGKVKALLDRTGGKKPFYVSGNTMSDVPMMHQASHIAKLIHSASEDHGIYSSELKAFEEARKNGWRFFDFKTGDHK